MGGEVSPKMVLDHTHTYHLQLPRGKYCLFSNIRWRPRYPLSGRRVVKN